MTRLPLASLLVLVGCDPSYTPCVETAGEVVMWASCPDHEAVELAGVTVRDAAGEAVWGCASPSRTGDLLDAVTYGSAPSGWSSTDTAPELEIGASYTVDVSYYDAMSATASFTAP